MKNYLAVHSTLAFRFWSRVESCGIVGAFTFAFGACGLMFAGTACLALGDVGGAYDCLAIAFVVPLVGMLAGFGVNALGQTQAEKLEEPEREISRRAFHRFISARDNAERKGIDVASIVKGKTTLEAAQALELAC